MSEPQGILWWNGRVPVRGEGPGITIMVGDVQRAAEMLLGWPLRGPLWRLAVQACVDAMEGKVTPDVARDAFREAAAEEGMYMRNLDEPHGTAQTVDRQPKRPRNRKPK